MEQSEANHTRVEVWVAFWKINQRTRKLKYDRTGMLEDGWLSTSQDWSWKPLDISKLIQDEGYDVETTETFTKSPMIWSKAMQQLQMAWKSESNDINSFHFHPLQTFDNSCQHLAMNCNIMVFLLHMDGITMSHLLTIDKGKSITVGFFLLNLKTNSKKSQYYWRVSIIPEGKEWSYDLIFMLIQKEIDSWEKGFPMQCPSNPERFVMVYPVFMGYLADGAEIADMLGKMNIKSFAGSLFLKECVGIHPTVIGTESIPCFISRRFLTNSVCLL